MICIYTQVTVAHQDFQLNGRYRLTNNFNVYELNELYKLTPDEKGYNDGMFYAEFTDSNFRIYEFTGCGNQCKRSIKGNLTYKESFITLSDVVITAKSYCKDGGVYNINEDFIFSLTAEEEDVIMSYRTSLLAAKLVDSKFRTNRIVFENPKTDSFNLTNVKFLMNNRSWGNFISFTDSSFFCYYSASCGNDCFTDLNGTYKFVSQDEIDIWVDTITKSGMCYSNQTEKFGSRGKFKIIENKDLSLTLKRIK